MIKDLQIVSPESEGIKSEDILEFIKCLEYHKINLHSFLMARNGKIVAEGYVPPFDKDFAHRIYSSSKTYVAMATGLLITNGKLKLTDKITDFLTDYIDSDLHKWKKEMTVEDCLTMSLPMWDMPVPPEDPHRACYNSLNLRVVHRPSGTLFQYNTGADFLAAAIKSITGQEFIEYLRPIFDEIGVSKDIWCVKSAEGYCWGGSGVICTLRDFAKFGEFVQNKGLVNGKQMIDRDFMEKATSTQICNLYANNYMPLKTGGYGYLMWITPDAACFRGMGAQTCVCFNEKNFMFVCQGDTQSDNDVQDATIYDMVKYLVYDRIGEKKEEGEAYLQLQEKLKNLKAPMYGEPHSDFEKEIDGKTYVLDDNPLGWENFRFDFSKDGKEGTITYENNRGVKTVKFGMGELKKDT
ncbi:MAG: serine hydrolase, partial [Clostridia bacterium]|nr:serine hydrolase [Clostridia bacterium]